MLSAGEVAQKGEVSWWMRGLNRASEDEWGFDEPIHDLSREVSELK